MTIGFQDFDSQFPLKDVTLVIIKNNENVTESLNKLTKNIDNTTAINILNDKYVPGIIIFDILL